MQSQEFVPQVIMLIGIPGSGKSTYIKKLMAQNPDREYVVLSTDDILELWGSEKGLDYNQAFKRFPFKQVEAEFYKRFNRAISNKQNVILDQTNLTIKSRDKKLRKVPSEYEKVGVVFEVDPDEIKRRLDRREIETGKSIPDNVITNMVASYQSPTNREFDRIVNVKN